MSAAHVPRTTANSRSPPMSGTSRSSTSDATPKPIQTTPKTVIGDRDRRRLAHRHHRREQEREEEQQRQREQRPLQPAPVRADDHARGAELARDHDRAVQLRSCGRARRARARRRSRRRRRAASRRRTSRPGPAARAARRRARGWRDCPLALNGTAQGHRPPNLRRRVAYSPMASARASRPKSGQRTGENTSSA